MSIFVLVAEYSDYSGKADLLAAFSSAEEAERLRGLIVATDPGKQIRVAECELFYGLMTD